jgi:hypothetical protein
MDRKQLPLIIVKQHGEQVDTTLPSVSVLGQTDALKVVAELATTVRGGDPLATTILNVTDDTVREVTQLLLAYVPQRVAVLIQPEGAYSLAYSREAIQRFRVISPEELAKIQNLVAELKQVGVEHDTRIKRTIDEAAAAESNRPANEEDDSDAPRSL